MVGSGAIVLRSRYHAAATSAGDGITVVSARKDDLRHPKTPSGGEVKPQPPLLDAAAADQLVTRYLPMLRQVQSMCDAEVCEVSAEPNAAGSPLDDQAFSQLVREDMPSILARSGHALTEPLQIEEIGPYQYRLLFRISRQTQ